MLSNSSRGGGELRLAAEAPDASVGHPMHAAGHAVPVAIRRVGQRGNGPVGDGVEQPEAEQVGRVAIADGGGRRGGRLVIDAERGRQRVRHLLLKDGPAHRRQGVAHPA